MSCRCRHCSHSQCPAGVATTVTRNVLPVSPLQSLAMSCRCRYCSHSQCHRPIICLYVSSQSAGTALPLKMDPIGSTETSLTNCQGQKSADRQLIAINSTHHRRSPAHSNQLHPPNNDLPHTELTQSQGVPSRHFPDDAVVTAYGLNDPQLQIHLVAKPTDQLWSPPRLIFNWYQGSFRGDKASGALPTPN